MGTGLVTNAPGENVGAVLPALRLEDYFDAVVPAEKVRAAKPEPDPETYLTAPEKLGAEPGEALAFEDSISGIRSAADPGVPTVGIASTQGPEPLREAGAFTLARYLTDPGLRDLLRG